MKMLWLGLIFFGSLAHAAEVPRCWQTDLPDQPIEDGMFRVFIPTRDHDATEVALAFALLSQSITTQAGVGTRNSLDRIEIDLYGDLKYWRPTATFPTLESFKDQILSTIEPVLRIPGVQIECATIERKRPPKN